MRAIVPFIYRAFAFSADRHILTQVANDSNRTTFVLSYGLSFLSITGAQNRPLLPCCAKLTFPFLVNCSYHHTWCVLTTSILEFFELTKNIAIIYFYKPIRLQIGRSLREQPDVHARLMSKYPQVPEWYYALLFGLYLLAFPSSLSPFS